MRSDDRPNVVIERPNGGRIVHPWPTDDEARMRVLERLCLVIPPEGSVWQVHMGQSQAAYAKVAGIDKESGSQDG